jgi:hypothetical protein
MLLIVPAVAVAQLGEHDQLVVQVPFSFVVANTVIPQGEILVQRADTAGRVLAIRHAGAKINIFATASTKAGPAHTGRFLIFNKYGDRYFLAGMKVEDSSQLYRFSPSKLEKEMLAQNQPRADEVLIATGR